MHKNTLNVIKTCINASNLTSKSDRLRYSVIGLLDLKNSNINRLNYSNYNCWSCNRKLTDKELKSFFCPCSSKHILPPNPHSNYFELFDLDFHYKIDKAMLTRNFRQLMRKLHPDLFTLKSEKEKQYSADQAALINKAYSVLNSSIDRGLYMLELNNIDYEKQAKDVKQSETKKRELLMHVMELNEFIDEINNPTQIKELEDKLSEIMAPFEENLEDAFNSSNLEQAIKMISKMKYFQNIDQRLKELKLKFDLENV